MPFGNGKIIASQAEHIGMLEDKIEDLERFSPSSELIATAKTIHSFIDDWVVRGRDPNDPAGGFSQLEVAMNSGIEEAAKDRAKEVFNGLPTDKLLETADRLLGEDEVKAIARLGLVAIFQTNPSAALSAFDPSERRHILDSILTDTALSNKIAMALERPLVQETSAVDLQAQYDKYGLFETDHLPEGAKVALEVRIRNENKFQRYIKANCRVIVSDEGERLMHPVGENAWPFELPFKMGNMDHQDFVPHIIPGTPIAIMAQDTKDETTFYRVDEMTSMKVVSLMAFSVNGIWLTNLVTT